MLNRHRRKRVLSVRHRALKLVAAHPDGCTEAILAAESIPADVLIELVRSGLAVAQNERIVEEGGVRAVTKIWITNAGEVVLAART
jgi:hypothetical protein